MKQLFTLTKEEIDAIFEEATDQFVCLNKLYRLVYPDFDRIEKIDGFPEAGETVWKYICEKFFEFDKKHHPQVMPGGCWLNHGFSGITSRKRGPWHVWTGGVPVRYKQGTHFRTSDGYTLEKRGHAWTDGDLLFLSDHHGWPIGDDRQPLEGTMFSKETINAG